jgi:hypothetical protein
MERSQSGYIEPMNNGRRANAARVQAVIRAISDRFTSEPFPAMSEHYKPEEVEMGVPVEPLPNWSKWDDMGCYTERSEVAQLSQTAHGWRVGQFGVADYE